MTFKRLRLAAILVAFGILTGTLGFHFLESADWFTSFYWMSAEFTLVGANDFTPHTFWGKIITIILFWTGVGTVSTVVSAAVNLDSRRLRQDWALSKFGYKDHVIIVGAGALGETVLELLDTLGEKKVIMIESNPAIVRRLEAKGHLVLEGDGGSDEVLKRAKVEDARLVIVATGVDSDNILTVIKARTPNRKVYIVARAKMRENYQKIAEYADLVVSPTLVGASLMALGESPGVSRFVHRILNIQEGHRLWEYSILPSSKADGKTVRELGLKERFNVSLVALRSGEDYVVNPVLETPVKSGDVLIMLAEESEFERATEFLES